MTSVCTAFRFLHTLFRGNDEEQHTNRIPSRARMQERAGTDPVCDVDRPRNQRRDRLFRRADGGGRLPAPASPSRKRRPAASGLRGRSAKRAVVGRLRNRISASIASASNAAASRERRQAGGGAAAVGEHRGRSPVRSYFGSGGTKRWPLAPHPRSENRTTTIRLRYRRHPDFPGRWYLRDKFWPRLVSRRSSYRMQ